MVVLGFIEALVGPMLGNYITLQMQVLPHLTLQLMVVVLTGTHHL
jgi:hypothetical protein